MESNKEILEKANKAVTQGDNEGFLAFCTEDVKWTFIGDQVIEGKQAILKYMNETYIKPPKFMVEQLVAEGDFVTAIGKISLKDDKGDTKQYHYCDIWRFNNGKMAALKAFVIEDVK